MTDGVLSRKELEQLEFWDSKEGKITFRHLYVIADSSVHESGWKYLKIYATDFDDNGNLIFAKQLSNCADGIDFRVDNSLVQDIVSMRHFGHSTLKMDCKECGVMRYFCSDPNRYTFEVMDGNISEFDVLIKKVK